MAGDIVGGGRPFNPVVDRWRGLVRRKGEKRRRVVGLCGQRPGLPSAPREGATIGRRRLLIFNNCIRCSAQVGTVHKEPLSVESAIALVTASRAGHVGAQTDKQAICQHSGLHGLHDPDARLRAGHRVADRAVGRGERLLGGGIVSAVELDLAKEVIRSRRRLVSEYVGDRPAVAPISSLLIVKGSFAMRSSMAFTIGWPDPRW